MKNLKIPSIIIFIGLFAIVGTSSCKKGDNDPFLSLKSRNARITGVWELTNSDYESKTEQTYSDGCRETYKRDDSFDGTVVTQYSSSSYSCYGGYFSEGTETTIYSRTLEIMKDGKYKISITTDNDVYESTGDWWWINSKKKKVRIAFDDDYDSYYIDMLKNNEMVFKQENKSHETSGSGYKYDFESSLVEQWTKKK